VEESQRSEAASGGSYTSGGAAPTPSSPQQPQSGTLATDEALQALREKLTGRS
jgi:hypothetical protein